jgi:hypothetical protein
MSSNGLFELARLLPLPFSSKFQEFSSLALGLFRRIFHGIMRSITASFPCPTSRFLGALNETRRDLRFFPEKIFSTYPLFHTKKNDRGARPPPTRTIRTSPSAEDHAQDTVCDASPYAGDCIHHLLASSTVKQLA